MKTNILLFLLFSLVLSLSSAEQCGHQAGGSLCPDGLCCSEWGFCGNTEPYCKAPGCQSQCTPSSTPPGPITGNLSDIISKAQFDEMLKKGRIDFGCISKGAYNYNDFITAAKSFPGFGTTGDIVTRKKEIAAFFGQTSHQTSGGYAPNGPFEYGYCFSFELGLDPKEDYCEPSATWPCASGKRYYGRGPMMLRWNYNYGQCGKAIGIDLLNNPDLATSNAVVAFKTAIWFWTTAQPPKPSCHAVITGQWQPSDADLTAGRLPGYGVTTNIINGGLECGRGQDQRVANRIGYFQRYCNILGANPGANLDCYNQSSFAIGHLEAAI